jgi:hypothetical protein
MVRIFCIIYESETGNTILSPSHRLEQQNCGKIPAPVDGGASLAIELAQIQSKPGIMFGEG